MYKGSRLQYIDGKDTVSMEVWHSHMLMVTTKLMLDTLALLDMPHVLIAYNLFHNNTQFIRVGTLDQSCLVLTKSKHLQKNWSKKCYLLDGW